jgi:hypothetical protein
MLKLKVGSRAASEFSFSSVSAFQLLNSVDRKLSSRSGNGVDDRCSTSVIAIKQRPRQSTSRQMAAHRFNL